MSLDRRQWLGGVGAAAAWVLAGCGGRAGGARGTTRAQAAQELDVRASLREALAILSAAGSAASVQATSTRRIAAAAHGGARGVRRAAWSDVVLAVTDGAGLRRRRRVDDLGADGVIAAAEALATAVGAGPAQPAPAGPAGPVPTRIGAEVAEDAGRWSDGWWLEQLGVVVARADRAGASRIIDRALVLEVEDQDGWSLAADRELVLRRVRARAGVSFLVWSAPLPSVGQLERAAVGADAVGLLSDDDLATAAGRALELTTPGRPTSAARPLALGAAAVATVSRALAAARRAGMTWPAPASAAAGPDGITVGVEPDPDQVGSALLDVDGAPASAQALIQAGGAGAEAAGGRAGGPGHLRWQPGSMAPGALLTGIDDGWLVDELRAAHLEPGSRRVFLLADRVREVRTGALSGRVFSDVVLALPLAGLVRPQAIGASLSVHGGRDDAGWWSVEAPALRVTAVVQGGRT